MSFGGWVGRGRRVPHEVSVSAAGYEDAVAHVQLEAGASLAATIANRLQ